MGVQGETSGRTSSALVRRGWSEGHLADWVRCEPGRGYSDHLDTHADDETRDEVRDEVRESEAIFKSYISPNSVEDDTADAYHFARQFIPLVPRLTWSWGTLFLFLSLSIWLLYAALCRIATEPPDSISKWDLIEIGSSGIPGGYSTRRPIRAPSSALPRFRTL